MRCLVPLFQAGPFAANDHVTFPARPGLKRLARRLGLLALTSPGLAFFQNSAAHAACIFVPAAGDDTFICDSGTSPAGLTDLAGSNTLLFPGGGTGNLNGNVVFGAGADRIEMQSGMITGTVDQGDGNDTFDISAGTVTGNVQQGSGIDDFRMTGGQIQSLSQGDNLDTFFMSGGHIINFFEDGDQAVMTGGRIGRVNMKLDDNLFDMSGGVIDNNLVAGFGNDTIILSNGTIGGNISVSGGTDRVTVTGGLGRWQRADELRDRHLHLGQRRHHPWHGHLVDRFDQHGVRWRRQQRGHTVYGRSGCDRDQCRPD